MKMILVTLGSMGDVLPFIALGIRLRQRGHEVTVLGHRWDEQLILGSGLEFYSILGFEEGQKALKHPDLFHPEKRLPTLKQHLYFPATLPTFDYIAKHFVWGDTVVVGPPWAYGARFAQEKLGVPLLTVLLAPWNFHEGEADPPPTDTELHRLLNGLRDKIGLEPISVPLLAWRNSPEKIVALFPEWFCEQEDWPDHALMTSFSMFDGSSSRRLETEVEEFLAKGERPLVFTTGTKMTQEDTFFEGALEASLQLGKRAIFLALFPGQFPTKLPDSVQVFDYVPLSLLLPHTEILVYHGGIGTCSHAFSAGLPHLIVPMIYDQFDNANRVASLGVGDQVQKEDYQGSIVAKKIEQLLGSEKVQKRCRTIAEQLEGEDALSETSLIIEAIVQ
ncbi:MAG: glycosyltransferase family 1 protein [SAR324 cluster bacterium]|nr:glycosyltransferase family 1 protein [SAR324 cluster bacterium]